MTLTVADHWSVPSAAADNTTLTKSSYTVSDNDVIVLIGTTWSRDHGLLTPTCSGQTVNTVQTAAPGAPTSFWGWLGVWTIKVTGNPGTITVSCAPADTANTRHDLFGIKCTGGDLDVSPATNATVTATGTTATVTLTTQHDGSIIVYGYVDLASQNPANTTYQSGAIELDKYDGHVGSNSVQASAWQSATTAGAQTIGIANTGSLTLTIVGVEIKAAASTVNGSASLSGSGTMTASGVATAYGTAALTGTGTLTAAGTATAYGTASLTAAGTMTANGTATAYGTAALSGSGRLTVTPPSIDINAVAIGPAERGWAVGTAERSWAIGPAEV